jgi:putative transposase
MSHYRRADISGGTYFFTVVTYRRQPILCDEAVRQALRTAITTVRRNQPFTVNAWVLLPDHLHCIWTLPEGDNDFSGRWARIKSSVSRSLGKAYHRAEWLSSSKCKHREATLWQRRFWEHLIRDEQDLQRHMDYLHYNPVKHGLVSHVSDWPYSTFHRLAAEEIYPADWAGDMNELDVGE